MGRMNNARKQQANAVVTNKSTRARFSTWTPPSKKKAGKGKGKGGRGRGGDRDDRGRGRGRGKGAPEERVIGRLTQRAVAKRTDAPRSATAAALEKQRKLLFGVDVGAQRRVAGARRGRGGPRRPGRVAEDALPTARR